MLKMNVLLIEGEGRLASFLRGGVRAEGWTVEDGGDAESGLAYVQGADYDVIVLEVALPRQAGREMIDRLKTRRRETPVLMLAALNATDDYAVALKMRGDDCLSKPFDVEELIARIQSLRKNPETGDGADRFLHHGPLMLDRDALQISLNGAVLELSAKERALLILFLTHRRKVLSRERILNAVWDIHEDPMTNIVDVYVGRLRKKLGRHGAMITTVRGAGYRLDGASGGR